MGNAPGVSDDVRGARSIHLPRPTQARGAARVERLLDAAADLVAEHGANGFAFRAVAQRARTAQGSLYQFFPNREAILLVLRERYARRLLGTAVELRQALDARGEFDAATLAHEIVDRFAPFYRGNPAYRELRRRPNAREDAIEEDLDACLAEMLAELVLRARPTLSRTVAMTAAQTIVEIADALLSRAADDERWRREAARAIEGYLREAGPR